MADIQNNEERQERTVRLVSIVSIDIVGFSSMSERDHRRAASQVENLRARIERVAAAHEGRLFNTAGDGFMLEFSSAGSALGAIQDILDKRAKGEPPVRVGAHVGDVVVTATNDLLGHGVNVAARLQSLAAPGSALVSSEFRSMAHSSPTAAFQSRGRQPLENIEQKVQTFEILSRRQKFARTTRQFGTGVGVAAVLGLLVYFGPFIYNVAKPFLPAQLQFGHGAVAETTTSATAPFATATTAAATPSVATTEPAAAPSGPTPGTSIRDCASACPELVVVPGGLFMMGSPQKETGRVANEGPQHEVSMSPFAVSKFEITFAQWDACLAGGGCNGYSPPDRGWGRGQKPVIGVSWNDAKSYVDWLNQQQPAHHYRLLSEAEWEYVARAGTTGAYAFGDRLTATQATFHARQTAPVGSHDANAWALFDMNGNASEWVEDCFAPTYQLAPVDGAAAESNRCARRVYRGGGWADLAPALRSAARRSALPTDRASGIGFRVARDAN